MVEAPKFAEDMLPSAHQFAAMLCVRSVGNAEIEYGLEFEDLARDCESWMEQHFAFGYIAYVCVGNEHAVDAMLKFNLRVLSDVAGVAVTRCKRAFCVLVHWDEAAAANDLRDLAERKALPAEEPAAEDDDEDDDD